MGAVFSFFHLTFFSVFRPAFVNSTQNTDTRTSERGPRGLRVGGSVGHSGAFSHLFTIKSLRNSPIFELLFFLLNNIFEKTVVGRPSVYDFFTLVSGIRSTPVS